MNINTKYLTESANDLFEFKLFKTTDTDIIILSLLHDSNDTKTLASIYHQLDIDSRSNLQKILDKLIRYNLIVKDGDEEENLIYQITKRGQAYLKCLELLNKHKLFVNDPYKPKDKNDKKNSLSATVTYHAGGKRIHEFDTITEFQDHLTEVNRINAYEENYYLIKPEKGSPEIHTLGDLRKKGIDKVSMLIK